MGSFNAQTLVPPVVILESQSVYVFASVAEAERSLEPIDVNEGCYIGYDAEGRLLDIGVRQADRRSRSFLPTPREVVRVQLAEGVTNRLGELRGLLLKYVGGGAMNPNLLANASMPELISIAREKSSAAARTWVSSMADWIHRRKR